VADESPADAPTTAAGGPLIGTIPASLFVTPAD